MPSGVYTQLYVQLVFGRILNEKYPVSYSNYDSDEIVNKVKEEFCK